MNVAAAREMGRRYELIERGFGRASDHCVVPGPRANGSMVALKTAVCRVLW